MDSALNLEGERGPSSGRSDLRWCLVFAAMLAVASSVPYLVGASGADSEWRFSGFVLAVEDGNSYIAKMLSGQHGDWLFRSPYSTMPQRGVLAFLPYLLLGKVSDGSHSQLVALFHLLRTAAIPLLVLAIYRFAGHFVFSRPWRRWLTVLAAAGGGLGWLALAFGGSDWLGSLPLEFYSPETFGLLAVLGFPHLILARAGLLWALSLYLSPRSGWAAGLVLLLTGILHSPILVPALAVLAAHQIALLAAGRSTLEWRRKAIAILLLAGPLLVYLTAALATDPFLQGWAMQNRIRSPHPLHYLLAYGALLPAVALGMRRVLRAPGAKPLLPFGWAVALPVLAYAPVDLQRRLTEGGWIALLILAAIGLAEPGDRRGMALRVGLAVLLLPSSLLLYAGSLANLRPPAEPLYQSTGQVDAFQWLADAAQPGSVVLGAFQTSNALPAWAPMKVVAGHGPESAGLAELSPQIEAFYSGRGSDEGRRSLVRDHGIDYVFWGPAERALDGWRPAEWGCLELAYRQLGFEIYEVCHD